MTDATYTVAHCLNTGIYTVLCIPCDPRRLAWVVSEHYSEESARAAIAAAEMRDYARTLQSK